MIDCEHSSISIYRQCELVGISRSGYYYKVKGENPLNLHLMRLIDEQYTKRPFYGVEKITEWLKKKDYPVNRKRIRRLMRKMGLEAIYPGPRLSVSNKEHRKYPYLLRNLTINRLDQVWCTDITYIRIQQGYIYLTAIMDWYSRYVLAWELSNTMDRGFCIEALERALSISGPEIFNMDQGSQFTSIEFTGILEGNGIRISMDGRGRVFDNIFIERLWRTVKYEEVYIHSYENIAEAKNSLIRYFHFYNTKRIHQSLGYKTPHEIYFGEDRNDNVQATGLIHLKKVKLLS